MTIKKDRLNQIASLLLLLVACLVAIKIFQGQNKKIVQLRQINNEQEKKNEILLHLGDLNKRITMYKESYKLKDSREIINTITNLAQASGVKIISLKPQDRPPERMRARGRIYDKIFFNLLIQVDDYYQISKFISRLENSPMLFFIESLDVRREEAAETELPMLPEKLDIKLIISKLFFQG